MKARELAARLMENPEDEVELWDQYDYCFGAWIVIKPETVVSKDGVTRFTTDDCPFHRPSESYC